LEVLGASDDEELVWTVALGYANPDEIVNTFITPREPVENFTVFLSD
ncbi:nitroreductase, partial [Acinetobacter ursingii]